MNDRRAAAVRSFAARRSRRGSWRARCRRCATAGTSARSFVRTSSRTSRARSASSVAARSRLRWSDVDLDAKLIHVRQNAVVVNYDLRLTDAKTTNGRRTIDVNDDVVRALQTWRRKQAEERLLLGAGYDDHDLVFARPDVAPTHPELISTTFERIVARSGLPRIRFHDVRHTHATLLLKAGVPIKVVSERLGHATASFTLDVYGWVLPGMQAEAAAVFSRLMATPPKDDESQAKEA